MQVAECVQGPERLQEQVSEHRLTDVESKREGLGRLRPSPCVREYWRASSASGESMDKLTFPNLGLGLGLRSAHYQHILDQHPEVGWFEALSDNYIHTRGRPLAFLDRVAERYPMVLHGVGMSIGSTDPLDFDYLHQIRDLSVRVGARWVSDHICFSSFGGHHAHDLLPLPFTEEALLHTAQRVRQVQDFLGQRLVLENPTAYLEFEGATLREWEFIAGLATEADCGLLLDVNNLYVNSQNHGFDPHFALRQLPLDRVVQFHVAGFSREDGALIDTHDAPVAEPVWQLLSEAWQLGAQASVLLEWDANLPDFETARAELERARVWLRGAPKAKSVAVEGTLPARRRAVIEEGRCARV